MSQVIVTSGDILPTPNAGFYGEIDNGIESIEKWHVKITLDISVDKAKYFNPNKAQNWKANVNSALATARATGITRIRIDSKTNAIYRFNTDGRTAIVNNEFYKRD